MFSTNGARTIDYQIQNGEPLLIPHSIDKINSKWISIKSKTIKLIKESIGEKSLWPRVRQTDMTPKHNP